MLRVATAARVARWTWARQSSALVRDARVARAAFTTASAEKITPMVQQYLARKKEYPDCMLLFQVGDFYEFFGEDARRASAMLSLALTRKSKQTSAFEDMCGFPMASLDSYVEKLVMHHGVKVAICNQVESVSSARQRGHKTLVDRQVVRIITPGSLVEDAMLSPAESNYLAAVYALPKSGFWGIAWADVSTGEFVSTTSTTEGLASTLLRCAPKEILLPDAWNDEHLDDETYAWVKQLDDFLPSSSMRTYRPVESFMGHVNVSAATVKESKVHESELRAAAAIVDYVAFTRLSQSMGSSVREPQHLESSDHMIIDASAWKGLEIAKSLSGTKQSSLLHCIDETVTPAGSRLLMAHLASPLTNIQLIKNRLDGVTHFYKHEMSLKLVRRQLGQVFDVERSIQRLHAGVGTPKDLRAIAVTILEAQHLARLVRDEDIEHPQNETIFPSMLQGISFDLALSHTEQHASINDVAIRISSALSDDRAALNTKAGFVKIGYNAELDRWRAIANVDPQTSLKETLQQKYRQLVGSTKLKVGYLPEKGYFVDIPHTESLKLVQASNTLEEPSDLEGLDMVQSLKNSARYRTKELKDLNREVAEAAFEVIRIENEIFESLRDAVLASRDALQQLAKAIALLDVVCSHAQVALDRNFSHPIVDMSTELHIEEGRHAVVEAAHMQGKNSKSGNRAFVPNSLHLTPSSGSLVDRQHGACWLLTGPNMGGKSTFLRQNAQIVILAQIGSYVPARFARVGVVDKLFCRVGSADDLASDRSTFMVEMQETATILTQATARSFVLMDEVGRGTAVDDGIAIAGAVLEALCQKQVRLLFATHFTVLGDLLDMEYQNELQFHRMEVLERLKGSEDTPASIAQLVFTHRVVEGLAANSYGIHTAALAGCPPSVVSRAGQLLEKFTKTIKKT